MKSSQGLLVALGIGAACIAGWAWHANTNTGWTKPETSSPDKTARATNSNDRFLQGDPSPGTSGKALADTRDDEWSKFRRGNVVVPAIATIPRHFGPDDTYRDEVLNPRDTYIPPPQRKQLSALVDSFMARIREADSQKLVDGGKPASKTPTTVNAAAPTKRETTHQSRSMTRQAEYLDAYARAQASGQPANVLIAQEVAPPPPARPSPSTTGQGHQPAITPPSAPEPVDSQALSIALRGELIERMTRLLLGIDVLNPLEANAITVSVKRRLNRSTK